MSFADRFKSTGLPADKVVVIGSGVLDQLGLRKSSDIDLVVAPELFGILKESGKYKTGQKYGNNFLEQGDLEVWDNWGSDFSFERLFNEGQTIEGVRFVSFSTLLEKKRERGWNKDLRDIEMIKEYLDKTRSKSHE